MPIKCSFFLFSLDILDRLRDFVLNSCCVLFSEKESVLIFWSDFDKKIKIFQKCHSFIFVCESWVLHEQVQDWCWVEIISCIFKCKLVRLIRWPPKFVNLRWIITIDFMWWLFFLDRTLVDFWFIKVHYLLFLKWLVWKCFSFLGAVYNF